MNEYAIAQAIPPKEPWWQRLQRGQAMVEYWPTIPAGVLVMVAAAAIMGPIRWAYQSTADVLNGCEVVQPGPTATDLDGGHHIEVVSSSFNGSETTVVFRVSSGDQPSISHWMLGIDEETAGDIVYASEPYEAMFDEADPTTGKFGIKFDTGYEGGGSGSDSGGGGPKKARIVNNFRPARVVYAETREIALTFAGRVDFVEYVDVTTKSGDDQVSTGKVSVPMTGGGFVHCDD